MDDFFYVVILLLLKHVHLEPFTSVKIVNNTVLHAKCLLEFVDTFRNFGPLSATTPPRTPYPALFAAAA